MSRRARPDDRELVDSVDALHPAELRGPVEGEVRGARREERQSLIAGQRKLKDDQEERWRAYLILRDVVRDSGKTNLGRQAAQLAIRCLRGISTERFGREDEIQMADVELSNWLRH